MTAASIHSDYLILDVKRGRGPLTRRILNGAKVRVLIEAEIDSVFGRDDGVSREFNCFVHSVKEVETV